MDLLTVDWETYYDDKYSLSHLTTEAYVRDPRFEPILVSLKFNDTPAFWILPERFAEFAQNEVDWSNTAVIAHHAHFDGLILSHHYGVRPAMWIDTLSMSRVIDGPKAGNSLEKLCIRHGLPLKGDYVVHAKGKHRMDFTHQEFKAYGAYSCNDSDRTYELAQIFLPQLPYEELKLIDLTVRMFTEPTLVGNTAMLQGAVASERQRKIDLLRRINLLCPVCQGSGVVPDLVTGTIQCKKCTGLGVDKKPIGSNEQFATLLRAQGVEPQTKTSPTTGEQIYAFAKTDPAMQELLEDEEEPVRFLAEARIGVKSNIIETRAQRFLHCAERGPMPVYLSYGAAHTLRWGGGDSMNWQNLSGHNEKRPEMAAIKGSVMAPPGHKLVRVDSSQGEARITAWCAGQQDLVEAFRGGRDVYSEHASSIFGRPVDRKRVKEDFIPGQIGKVCLAAGTLIITQRGPVPIEHVTISDTLWDGVEWVQHTGLVFQGVKEVVQHEALSATADHEILTGHGWREWSEVITSPSLFQSALDLASLPSSAGSGISLHAGITNTGHYAAVPVGPRPMSLDTPSKTAVQLGAMRVQLKRQQESGGNAISTLWPMIRIASVYLTDCLPLFSAVTTPNARNFGITASVAYQYFPNGVTIEPRFSSMFRHSLGGTRPNWNWTEKTQTAIMSPVISDLLRALSTWATSAKSWLCSVVSKNSKQKTPTYDLACAGPRSRFTVLTSRGPLIVHNCILGMGYGMGYLKAAGELLKGMLGAPPIQFTMKDMEVLGVDPSAFLNKPKLVEAVNAMPSRLELHDRFIHCIVTKALIDRYRIKYDKITAYWKTMDQVIGAMIAGTEMVFGAHGIMRTGKDCIYMPNGMKLNYRGLERSDSGDATYFNGRERVRLHGPLLTENTTQCLHRILVAGQMLEIAEVLRVGLMTHDDIVSVVPAEAAPLALDFMTRAMSHVPSWAVGLPLTGEGKIGDSLLEVK